MMRYLIVIEKADGNYSAYSPDIPGCVATGHTPEEARKQMESAIALHVAGLREDEEPLPVPSSTAEYVEV